MSKNSLKVGKMEIDSDDGEPSPKKLRSTDEEERRSILMSPTESKLVGGNALRGGRGPDKAAELFRKDLISAMKLPDTEPLQPEDYIVISDPWRQEWERGVQVPVNAPEERLANVRVIAGNEKLHGTYPFKLPYKKLLHAAQDDTFKQSVHELHDTQSLAEQVCRYDLDYLDVMWLGLANEELELMGVPPIEEWVMEKILEEIESQCHEKMKVMIKTVEGLGIEYDENVVCDVCRSPESEDGNEMVFCDNCDICVHQACYGIQSIPEGSWLCRICALGLRPLCILCPLSGGAMKSTKSGTKWAHVSCALWIPEVSIGCPEKMEPITKISHIPSSRWGLVCSVCRDRYGACIQCSVKTCKTAMHVSCAFQGGLEMRTVLDEEGDEEIQLKAYCLKHSKKMRAEENGTSPPNIFTTPITTPNKKECDMTEEEKTELRSHRLQRLSEEFYRCVKVEDVAKALQLPEDMVDYVHKYWTLKRKSMFDKPLLTPKTEEADLLSKQQEDSLLARMKMFVQLRQDLERVRNLCYMVSKREKMRRQMYRLKEDIFHRQLTLLTSNKHRYGVRETGIIAQAHKLADGIYDKYDGILRVAKSQDPDLIIDNIDHTINIRKLNQVGRPRRDSVMSTSEEVTKPTASASKPDVEQPGPSKSKRGPGRRPARLSEEIAKHRERITQRRKRLQMQDEQPCSVTPKDGSGEGKTKSLRQQASHRETSKERLEAIEEKHSPRSGDPAPPVEDHKELRGSKPPELPKSGSKDAKNVPSTTPETEEISLNSEETVENLTASRRRSATDVLKPQRGRGRPRKSDVNGVIPHSNLVVSDSIKQKIQNRLHRVNRLRTLNGHVNTSARFFSSESLAGSEMLSINKLTDASDDQVLVYKISKSPVKISRDSSSGSQKSEPRVTRQRAESDMDSESNMSTDHLFESVDGEVSIRSSRSTTPDCEMRKAANKDVGLSHIMLQRQLNKRSRRSYRGLTPSEVSEDPEQDMDSDYAASDSASECSSYSTRRTRRQALADSETASLESGTSSGKYSTRRSKQTKENISGILNVLPS